jgi:hypothetical protein
MSPTGRLNNLEPEMQSFLRPYQRDAIQRIASIDYSEIELRCVSYDPPTVMPMREAHHHLMEYRRLQQVLEYNRSGRNPRTRGAMRERVVANIERKIARVVEQFPTVHEWHEKTHAERS